MIQIDANSTFFLIRNNEEIRGAWNVAQNTVKIYVAKTLYAHIFGCMHNQGRSQEKMNSEANKWCRKNLLISIHEICKLVHFLLS